MMSSLMHSEMKLIAGSFLLTSTYWVLVPLHCSVKNYQCFQGYLPLIKLKTTIFLLLLKLLCFELCRIGSEDSNDKWIAWAGSFYFLLSIFRSGFLGSYYLSCHWSQLPWQLGALHKELILLFICF